MKVMTHQPLLHAVTVEDVAIMREVAHLARACSTALAQQAAASSAAVCLSLARARYPDDRPADALQKLLESIQVETAEREAVRSAWRAISDTEQKRLDPMLGHASRCQSELAEELRGLDRQQDLDARRTEAKRKSLQDAGLSKAEIDGHLKNSTEVDEARESRRAEIRAEVATLNEFIRTRDETLLPEGFAEAAHARYERFAA
jgi:hypothetical protein